MALAFDPAQEPAELILIPANTRVGLAFATVVEGVGCEEGTQGRALLIHLFPPTVIPNHHLGASSLCLAIARRSRGEHRTSFGPAPTETSSAVLRFGGRGRQDRPEGRNSYLRGRSGGPGAIRTHDSRIRSPGLLWRAREPSSPGTKDRTPQAARLSRPPSASSDSPGAVGLCSPHHPLCESV